MYYEADIMNKLTFWLVVGIKNAETFIFSQEIWVNCRFL